MARLNTVSRRDLARIGYKALAILMLAVVGVSAFLYWVFSPRVDEGQVSSFKEVPWFGDEFQSVSTLSLINYHYEDRYRGYSLDIWTRLDNEEFQTFISIFPRASVLDDAPEQNYDDFQNYQRTYLFHTGFNGFEKTDSIARIHADSASGALILGYYNQSTGELVASVRGFESEDTVRRYP